MFNFLNRNKKGLDVTPEAVRAIPGIKHPALTTQR